jgi:hypothetical protein
MVNFFDAMITQEERNFQDGGAKKAKKTVKKAASEPVTRKYTGKECKCPDNVVRKPFTLTGNTQYVVYKGKVVRPSSIPKEEKPKKAKKSVKKSTKKST